MMMGFCVQGSGCCPVGDEVHWLQGLLHLLHQLHDHPSAWREKKKKKEIFLGKRMLCRSFEDASVLQVDSGFPIQGMDKKRRGLGDWLCQRTEPRLSKKLVAGNPGRIEFHSAGQLQPGQAHLTVEFPQQRVKSANEGPRALVYLFLANHGSRCTSPVGAQAPSLNTTSRPSTSGIQRVLHSIPLTLLAALQLPIPRCRPSLFPPSPSFFTFCVLRPAI